jgi:hypothetical protein
LYANNVCLSVRVLVESSSKEAKENRGRNMEKLLDCVAPDGLLHGPAQLSALGFFQPTSAKIHRIVRTRHQKVWCISHATASCHVGLGPTVIRRTGQSGAPHWTVRCPTEAETNQSGDSLSCPVRVLFIVRCAPDSPVRQRTEGKHGLPNVAPTAPSSLRAIKGTPRSMNSIPSLH